MTGHSYLRNHNLQAEHMLLDFAEATRELHAKTPDQSRGGIALAKQGGMSLVLTHLQAGGELQEHAAPGAATVQVLEGRVRMIMGDESTEVRAGQLIAFDSGVRHSVQADEDSVLLLTLVRPS